MSPRQRGHLETPPHLVSLGKDVKLGFKPSPSGIEPQFVAKQSCATPAPHRSNKIKIGSYLRGYCKSPKLMYAIVLFSNVNDIQIFAPNTFLRPCAVFCEITFTIAILLDRIFCRQVSLARREKFVKPCLVGLVISVSASHTVVREFASRPGHTKDHHKNGTNCLPAWHAIR